MSAAIHYLGSAFASSAACGRLVLTYREDEHGGPAHTDDRSKVTCRRCLAAMGA